MDIDSGAKLPRENIGNRIFAFIEALRPSDKLILKCTLFVCVISLGLFAINVSREHLIEIPNEGGLLREGIIGTPRFINPLLSITNADKDMAALLYSGLMRLNSEGILETDLAKSVTVSEDGLTYNVVIRNDATFHDGVQVTADDVLFTIERAQDPALKSPLIASWEGITVERLGDHEVNFILPEAYAPFIENLTLGILPRHIWESAEIEQFPFSQYNSEPIGSGPYKIDRVVRSQSGIPESYVLIPHNNDSAVIGSIELRFFPNEDALVSALERADIDSAAGLSAASLERLGNLEESHTLYTAPLPRTFAIFFNQNEMPLLRDASVRKALDLLIDRDTLVREALGGLGYTIDGPIPPGFDIEIASGTPALPNLEEARFTLRDGGWKFDEVAGTWSKTTDGVTETLAFSLATANNEVLQKTADILKSQWEQIGIQVDVKKFEQTDLTQSIIRPRKFEALLFGTVVGRDLDFYSFWHSSQRNDPGLNVSLYANITTDSLLSEARTTTSAETRKDLYERFADEVRSERPALFLYTPSFTYLAPKDVHNINVRGIAEPHERFATIREWYMETEPVWQMFAN